MWERTSRRSMKQPQLPKRLEHTGLAAIVSPETAETMSRVSAGLKRNRRKVYRSAHQKSLAHCIAQFPA